MKVLYLTDNGSVHNRRFLEKLAAAGHEVWAWNLGGNEACESLFPGGVHGVIWGKRVNGSAGPEEYKKLLPQMHVVLDKVRPDLVHAGPIQSAGYLAALADFHPTLLMSWGSDLLLHAERDEAWMQATEIALQKADGFFCDCETVRKAASRYRLFVDSRVVQLPWGVKLGMFSASGPLPPKELFVREEGTTTFIYTRSFDALYRTDVLLEAFRKAHLENSRLRLVVIGNVPQEFRNSVEASGLCAVVSFPEPQPSAMLPMWFRAVDAYVSCAISDGTSVSLLEAMATGLPVIVTDIPSNREWVTEPENGWLAEGGSSDALAGKMLEAAQLTFAERNAIAERNQRIVAERADWDKNFPRLLEMYERLI